LSSALSAQNSAHHLLDPYLAMGANDRLCSHLHINCKTGSKLFNVYAQFNVVADFSRKHISVHRCTYPY